MCCAFFSSTIMLQKFYGVGDDLLIVSGKSTTAMANTSFGLTSNQKKETKPFAAFTFKPIHTAEELVYDRKYTTKSLEGQYQI